MFHWWNELFNKWINSELLGKLAFGFVKDEACQNLLAIVAALGTGILTPVF